MRTLYGLSVPDGARLVEVRALVGNNSRSRVIFRGLLEEHGITTTEESISDYVATDSKFWDWIGAQIRQRRISADSAGDGTVVRLKLSVSFINQDASKAILDESSGSTSIVTEESWEFYKSSSSTQDQSNPMAMMERFMTLMIEQQKELPNQIARLLSIVTDTGKAAIQTSAAESSKILQAAAEPMKAQMELIGKSHTHETTRADRASDAVIRMLNSDDYKKGDNQIDDLIKLVSAAPMLLTLFEKLKKQAGNE